MNGKLLILLVIVYAALVLFLKLNAVQAVLLLMAFGIGFFILTKLFMKLGIVVKLREYERAVVFRFGRFSRVAGPGWTFIMPFIEAYRRVDLRTKTLDVPKQDVITKDSVAIKIDAVIYLRVHKDDASVANSVLEVENFEEASRTYVMASLRDIVGGMLLSDVIANIDKINKRLQEMLASVASYWGVEVVAVQIKDIDLPETIVNAMHQEKAALQQMLATKHKAEAQKIEINALKEAAGEMNDRTLQYCYLKALEKISDGKSTKIIFPLEFSSLAKSISESFAGKVSEDVIREALRLYIGKAVAKAKRAK